MCAIFGAPTAHDDEPQRAARAAAAMHEALAERSRRRPDLPPLRVHAGINTGIVIAGGVGDGSQFGVMGDTINTANRLMGLAQPGQTFVSAETARRLRRQFQLLDRGSQPVKGRRQPVAVFEVGARLEGDGPGPGGLRAPFVGRASELAALRELLAARRGSLVVVTGEPGIGKSRLGAELAEEFAGDGWRILRASARLAGDVPNAVVMNALAPVLGDRAGPEAVSSESLADALAGAADDGPVLVVLDDIDQADDSSITLLDELIRATGDHPVSWLVVGRRPPRGLSLAEKVEVVRIDPLDATAGAALVAGLLPGAFTDAEAARLAGRGEGNPTFIEEIALELIDEGVVVERADASYELVGDPSAVAVPGSVTELIEARIDAMATAARITLQEASVVGLRFRRRLLERVASLPAQVGAALAELRAEELITAPDDELGFWSFRSHIIRDVAYNGILRRRRPAAHRAVAEALIELEPDSVDENAELLAHHYERSDRPELAVPFFERAIRHAEAAGQPAAADAIARRALAIADRHPASVGSRLVANFRKHLEPGLG